MNHKERMLAGLPYKAWLDGLDEERRANRQKTFRYNHLPPDCDERDALIRQILGACGKNVRIEGPFYCDYGYNIHVGENFFANYNFTVLDVARVSIGAYAMIAPNVAIYTAGHPLHPQARNSGYEYGLEVHIGDNVWIGGNTVINPGVRVGNNVVIGSGSVVTRDIPDNMLAAGNPCRALRAIRQAERHCWHRDRRFDVDDYLLPLDGQNADGSDKN